jgi:putative ribosome biogenesis GTPase RsgA
LPTDGRSLVVLGEAGIGKSTLPDQLRDLDGFSPSAPRAS